MPRFFPAYSSKNNHGIRRGQTSKIWIYGIFKVGVAYKKEYDMIHQIF